MISLQIKSIQNYVKEGEKRHSKQHSIKTKEMSWTPGFGAAHDDMSQQNLHFNKGKKDQKQYLGVCIHICFEFGMLFTEIDAVNVS